MSVNDRNNHLNAVVFDLGGVVAEISHSWEDAAKVAGVACKNLSDGHTRLAALEVFDTYQAAGISLDEYLARLAEFVGCDPECALSVHNGILVAEYPGVKELIEELLYAGFRTGCLSNTNQPHWEVFTGQYPTVHLLQMPMASHLVGINKPAPEIFKLYCEQYGLDPSEIAYFDDYPINVEAARECGWNAFRIDPSQDTPTQMREYLASLGVNLTNVIA